MHIKTDDQQNPEKEHLKQTFTFLSPTLPPSSLSYFPSLFSFLYYLLIANLGNF